MIRFWILAILASLSTFPQAASLDDMVAVRSRGGGQFIIHGKRLGFGTDLMTVDQPSGGPIQLDPGVVAISCDRIKQELQQTLASPDRWRGKIHVFINSSLPSNHPADIQSSYYADGWQGRIDLPARLEADKLVRAVLHALLLEMANRAPPNYTAELPLWLTEGLTQLLLYTKGNSLILEPRTRTIRTEVHADPLAPVRARLEASSSLSFGELSLPGPEQLSPLHWPRYQDSACWMVNQLLQLPNGRALMAGFISRLALCLNWQTAFFQSYGSFFERPIDVEKWWLLGVINGANRDKWLALVSPVFLDKLQEILQVPVSIRHAAEQIPVLSNITLQEFIEQWNLDAQVAVLSGKIIQLDLLQINAPDVFRPLIAGYHGVLSDYLANRQKIDLPYRNRGAVFLPAPLLIPRTVQQLDELDAKFRLHRQQHTTG